MVFNNSLIKQNRISHKDLASVPKNPVSIIESVVTLKTKNQRQMCMNSIQAFSF